MSPRAAAPPLKSRLNVLQWFRFAVERFVIVPAARSMPLSVALAAANFAGRVDAALPTRSSREARRELAAAGVGQAALGSAVQDKLANPRRNLVWMARQAGFREPLSSWECTQINAGPMQELLAKGQPFILAGGHFMTAAGNARHLVIPANGASVNGATPRWSLWPFELRRRLETQLEWKSRPAALGIPRRSEAAEALFVRLPDLWQPGLDWATVEPEPHVQERLLADLSRAGSVAHILIDAIWEKPGAYRRPFAGTAERGFALGAARIARLAQCPVVPFVALLGDEPRSVVLEWGDPIAPAADRDGDRQVIDEALDFLERRIQRFPEQYLHPIGLDRVWNATNDAWEMR